MVINNTMKFQNRFEKYYQYFFFSPNAKGFDQHIYVEILLVN